MRKGLILLLVVVCVVLVGATYAVKQSAKGGKDAQTMFEVSSDTLTVTYDGRDIEYKGDQRKELIDVFKDIANDKNELKDNSQCEYDIEIEFNNGNSAKISSDSNIFELEEIQYEVSQSNMDKILSIVGSE